MLWALLVCCVGGATEDDSSPETGAGSDTGPGSGSEDCSESWEDAAPGGPDCTSGTLTCGDVVEASTGGGGAAGDSELYESATCFVPGHDYDGPDRFYVFTAEEDSTFSVTLESPCEALSLAVMRWDEAECPVGNAHNINVCDGYEATTGTDTLELYTANEAQYYVAVDGESGVEGNFRLSLACD